MIARMPELDGMGHPAGTSLECVAVLDPTSFIILLAMDQSEDVTVAGLPMTVATAMRWLVQAHEADALPVVTRGSRADVVPLASLRNHVADPRVALSPQYALAFVSRMRRMDSEGLRLRGAERPGAGPFTERRGIAA